MAYNGTYRTKSGRNYFRFSFVQQPNGEVRAYIESQPSYGGRPTDRHSTHRHWEGSRPYVCFEPLPRNLAEAIDVAKSWAEHTEQYVRNGTPF